MAVRRMLGVSKMSTGANRRSGSGKDFSNKGFLGQLHTHEAKLANIRRLRSYRSLAITENDSATYVLYPAPQVAKQSLHTADILF